MSKKMTAYRSLTGILVICLVISSLCGCTGKRGATDVTSETETEAQKRDVLTGHNEDESSNLGAWGRAMGAVLISMNDGNPYYFGGYEATEANSEAAEKILQSSWRITSRKGLLRQIKTLLMTGSRRAYRREAKELNAMTAKKRRQALRQVSGTLAVHYADLQYNWDTWGRKGLLAWDLCRISHLVQWGYIAGYVNREEAQALLEPAARRLRKNFDSWEDVVYNWLDGYCYSASIAINSKEKTEYDQREEVYLDLVEQQKDQGTLFDDTLFESDILPLEQIRAADILAELDAQQSAQKNTSQNGQKNQKKKNSNVSDRKASSGKKASNKENSPSPRNNT